MFSSLTETLTSFWWTYLFHKKSVQASWTRGNSACQPRCVLIVRTLKTPCWKNVSLGVFLLLTISIRKWSNETNSPNWLLRSVTPLVVHSKTVTSQQASSDVQDASMRICLPSFSCKKDDKPTSGSKTHQLHRCYNQVIKARSWFQSERPQRHVFFVFF